MLIVGREWVADCHLHPLRGGAKGFFFWLGWFGAFLFKLEEASIKSVYIFLWQPKIFSTFCYAFFIKGKSSVSLFSRYFPLS